MGSARASRRRRWCRPWSSCRRASPRGPARGNGCRSVGEERSELVTMRATPGFGEFWPGPRMHGLYAAHPELDVRVTSTIWNTELLEAGIDLEIRYGTDEWPELERRRLTREHLAPVCSPALAEWLGNDPARLAQARLLHVDGFRNGWPAWLHQAGVADRVDGGSGSHFDTAILPIQLAEHGLGVALGRWSMTEPRIAAGTLVRPFAVTMPTEEAFYVCWPSEEALRPEAALVRDWLVEQARDP
ncbi:MAG: LysR substrate-binding domain-containing protein [Halofilum sp. (in: g-proteobacteria)]|nr:LysR substrate-binding domain-containing protein [Halofilum sp. (in: g-proteobacteria)]